MPSSLTRTTLDFVEGAAQASGVPFAAGPIIALKAIADHAEDVGVQRRKARQLAQRASQLLLSLEEQSQRLVGSELSSKVDEVTAILEKIVNRVKGWRSYNRVRCFLKNAEIGKGLDQCNADLSSAMESLQMNTHIMIHTSQINARDVERSNSAEVKDLLFEILTKQTELQRVVEMHTNGEVVAEPLMREGQLALRQLRRPNVIPEDRAPSPTWCDSPLSASQISDPDQYASVERGLYQLHSETGVLPSIPILNDEITKYGEIAIAGGTYSDVWMGLWLHKEKVAMKALRNIKTSNLKAQRRFDRELKVWKDLKHPNILPFYGVVTNIGGRIHTVSPWVEHGNVLEYTDAHPESSKLALLADAASGLQYLHSKGITHGNIKCANILVQNDGKACICDFGMSRVIEDVTEKSAASTLTTTGSARWLAPEMITGTVVSPNQYTDTYSFSMAILELLTGKVPFSDRKRDANVIFDIVVNKKVPARPSTPLLSDNLWNLMQECWNVDTKIRPTMEHVSNRLREIDTS